MREGRRERGGGGGKEKWRTVKELISPRNFNQPLHINYLFWNYYLVKGDKEQG